MAQVLEHIVILAVLGNPAADMSVSDDEEVPIAVGLTENASLPQLGAGFEADAETDDRLASVPVTLITGCLGAGEQACTYADC